MKAWLEPDSMKIETVYNHDPYYSDQENRFFEQLIPVDENIMRYRYIIEKLDSTEEVFWGELVLLRQ